MNGLHSRKLGPMVPDNPLSRPQINNKMSIKVKDTCARVHTCGTRPNSDTMFRYTGTKRFPLLLFGIICRYKKRRLNPSSIAWKHTPHTRNLSWPDTETLIKTSRNRTNKQMNSNWQQQQPRKGMDHVVHTHPSVCVAHKTPREV